VIQPVFYFTCRKVECNIQITDPGELHNQMSRLLMWMIHLLDWVKFYINNWTNLIELLMLSLKLDNKDILFYNAVKSNNVIENPQIYSSMLDPLQSKPFTFH
jgi:hypothetical protein